MHSVTDRRTDGQQAYANSRSYCVAVRSAKNEQNNYSSPKAVTNMTNILNVNRHTPLSQVNYVNC